MIQKYVNNDYYLIHSFSQDVINSFEKSLNKTISMLLGVTINIARDIKSAILNILSISSMNDIKMLCIYFKLIELIIYEPYDQLSLILLIQLQLIHQQFVDYEKLYMYQFYVVLTKYNLNKYWNDMTSLNITYTKYKKVVKDAVTNAHYDYLLDQINNTNKFDNLKFVLNVDIKSTEDIKKLPGIIDKLSSQLHSSKRHLFMQLLVGNNHSFNAGDYYCGQCKLVYPGIKFLLAHVVLFNHATNSFQRHYDKQVLITNINNYTLKNLQQQI